MRINDKRRRDPMDELSIMDLMIELQGEKEHRSMSCDAIGCHCADPVSKDDELSLLGLLEED